MRCWLDSNDGVGGEGMQGPIHMSISFDQRLNVAEMCLHSVHAVSGAGHLNCRAVDALPTKPTLYGHWCISLHRVPATNVAQTLVTV